MAWGGKRELGVSKLKTNGGIQAKMPKRMQKDSEAARQEGGILGRE